jgi:flagella basal body P-ring formation protein FlgA
MTSSARPQLLALAVWLALGATPAMAQAPVAGAVPAGLTGRVTSAIAALWAVSDTTVRVEWGSLPAGVTLVDSTAFRLVGNGERGWFAVVLSPATHAPVASRLHAGVAATVQVAARPLAAGATLAAADITTAVQVVWAVPTSSAARAVTAGWITRRSLALGDRLDPLAAAPPPVVLANAPVRVEWVRNGIEIELDGTAMNAAAVGQTVSVRFADRTQTATGVATGSGRVRIGT